MNAPTTRGYWWAMSRFDMEWSLFAVDYIVDTCRLVVRLAGTVHSRRPWFTPTPGDWVNWQQVPEPPKRGKYAGVRYSWP